METTDDPASADYWLAGEPDGNAVRYRWVRRATATSGDSLQPLPAYAGAVPADAPESLVGAARRIARVQSWLTVPSPETASFPVQALGLRRRSDGLVLRPNPETGVLTIPASEDLCSRDPDGCYTLALGVTEADLEAYREAAIWDRWDSRYAYAFIIDPAGESCLFFPYNRCREGGGGVENTLNLADPGALSLAPTTSGDSVHVFDLGRLSPPLAFRSGPFGRHTLVLLTMNEREPNPGAAFNWPAVHLGEKRGDVEEPDSWSVRRLAFDVIPGAPAPSAPSE